MQTQKFDELCRALLDDFLGEYGFAWSGKGVYLRVDDSGHDYLAIDRSAKKGQFRVLLGYTPEYLHRYALQIHRLKREDSGVPQRAAYLNPAGMSEHSRWWSCRTQIEMQESMVSVRHAFEQVGEKRLRSLRVPHVFAAEADSGAAVSVGLACEAAGDHDGARQHFSEMRRRYLLIHKESGGLEQHPSLWADFLFVMSKLGESSPLVIRISELHAGRTPSPDA